MSRACALLLRVALSPAATHHKSAFLVSVAHSLGQRILLPLFHLLAAERAADVQIKTHGRVRSFESAHGS